MIASMREAGVGIRGALRYSGSSWNLYYHQEKPRLVLSDPRVVRKVQELILERPSYGTRRVAAQLSRELGVPINRKRVQKIFRELGYTEPAKTKSEIIRATDKAPKASRPCELWQTDLTYIPCGVDGWCYLFNVIDVFSREWAGKEFSPTAVKDNAILSVENALVSHRRLDPTPRLRADNGPQYTSKVFRESMQVLGLKLEHIMYRTPEQNGAIESFHRTLKKEYVWPYEFESFQDAEKAVEAAFVDYNERRIHSSLGYLTPSEFLELWYADADRDEQKEKLLNAA
ncbi:MAG: IS3 family transposase [Thaumarchaeota archaeon]|nr:IS3 family transposase [Nitrososphaerota archaeon]